MATKQRRTRTGLQRPGDVGELGVPPRLTVFVTPADTQRYITVNEAVARYGACENTWRSWIWEGRLGQGVVIRLGRTVRLDRVRLDQRLEAAGQLLVPLPAGGETSKLRRRGLARLKGAQRTRSRPAPAG
jgi:hypothetical protein